MFYILHAILFASCFDPFRFSGMILILMLNSYRNILWGCSLAWLIYKSLSVFTFIAYYMKLSYRLTSASTSFFLKANFQV